MEKEEKALLRKLGSFQVSVQLYALAKRVGMSEKRFEKSSRK
jgi:hypothetical protein